jgi:hypothetical protein
VVLHYIVGSDGPWNRRIPTFQPAARIQAQESETLTRGQIPPASRIVWWWTLTAADGTQFQTERADTTYLDERFDWHTRDFPAVEVLYYGSDDVATQVAESAQTGLDRVFKLLGGSSDEKIRIVVYRTRDDMLPALLDRGEAYEARLTTLGARVARNIVIVLADQGPERGLSNVLAHELAHIALHLRFQEDYVDAPLWLDEGLAMYNEGPLSADDQRLLQDTLRNDRALSLRSLTSFPGQTDLVPVAYAESRDVVAFLLDTYGQDRLRQLVEGIGQGQWTDDEVLKQVYGTDSDGLYLAYRSARGLGAPEVAAAEPSPRDKTCLPLALIIALPAAVVRRRRPATSSDARPPQPAPPAAAHSSRTDRA